MNLQKNNSASFRPRPNSDLSILENPLEWLKDFQRGWLAAYEKTGIPDWNTYTRPRNHFTPSGSGVDLAKSRLMLVSSAGGYLPDSQIAFDEHNPLGDYSIRVIPSDTPLPEIKFAHVYYNHKYADEDPQVLIPLKHLKEMMEEGVIGEVAPIFVSFNGHQPNVIRVVKELVPAIIKVAKEHAVQAVLLVPVSPLCIQSAGLAARGLEVNNVATTMTSWSAGLATSTAPPRITITKLPRGSTLGMPGNHAQQRRVIEATLARLAYDAPLEKQCLDEKGE
jgi:D-proline reductase (dithiol) PrdB